MAPETIYRSFDGLDWPKFEQAQKWEERLNAVKRSLDEIESDEFEGIGRLCLLTQNHPERDGGFLNRYVFDLNDDGTELAECLEEIASLGQWAQKILDEVGECPIHPKYLRGTMR